MYLDQWTPYEYKLLCAYEEYYDKGIEMLEQMGLEGKMILAALLREKGAFKDLYKKTVENEYLNAYGDN